MKRSLFYSMAIGAVLFVQTSAEATIPAVGPGIAGPLIRHPGVYDPVSFGAPVCPVLTNHDLFRIIINMKGYGPVRDEIVDGHNNMWRAEPASYRVNNAGPWNRIFSSISPNPVFRAYVATVGTPALAPMNLVLDPAVNGAGPVTITAAHRQPGQPFERVVPGNVGRLGCRYTLNNVNVPAHGGYAGGDQVDLEVILLRY